MQYHAIAALQFQAHRRDDVMFVDLTEQRDRDGVLSAVGAALGVRAPTPTAVIDAINRRPKPLALYLFSTNKANIEQVLTNTSAGGTCLNDTLLQYLHPELPFGGTGNSGIGKGFGYAGFLAFSNERPVLRQRLKNGPFKHFYPPYGKKTRVLIDLLLKYF